MTSENFEEIGLEATLRNIRGYTADADRMVSKNRQIARSLGDAAGGSLRLGSQVSALSKSMLRFATISTVAFAAVAGPAVKFAADFEEVLSRIAGLTDTPRAAIDGLRKDILVLSREVAKSPEELGSAAYFILSSGISDVSTALRVLELASKAATAGLGDTQTIARAVTAVLNAYQLGAQDAAQVTDTLVNTIKLGAGEPAELASSFGFIIPLAAQMGIEFEQLGAVLATLTNIGLGAENAVTALRGVLSQLLRPTDESREAFAALGIDVETFRREVDENFVVAMNKLFTAFDRNATVAAELFPDVRGLIGALGAFGVQGEQTERVLNGIVNGAGALDLAFEEATNTANFKFRKALNLLKVEATELGLSALPDVTRALDALTPKIGQFADAARDFRPVAAEIKSFALFMINNREVLVGTIVAIGVAFAFAHPGGALLLGLGLLAGSLAIVSTETDELSGTALEAKISILEFAEAAIIGFRAMADAWVVFMSPLAAGLVALGLLPDLVEKGFAKPLEEVQSELRKATERSNELTIAQLEGVRVMALFTEHTEELTKAADDGEQGLIRWAFQFANAEAEAENMRRTVAFTNAEFIAYRDRVFESTRNTILYVNAISPIPNTLQSIANAAANAGVSIEVFTAQLAASRAQLAALTAQATLAAGVMNALITSPGRVRDLSRIVDEALAEVSRLTAAANQIAAEATAGAASVVGAALIDATEATVEEVESVWARGARLWMEAVEKGILDGTIDVLDALDFLERGMVDAARSIVEGLARQADDIAEQMQIMNEVLATGLVTIQQVARLFELGAIEEALDFLRFLAGRPSEIGEAIGGAARARVRPIFPTAQLHAGGLIPEGKTVPALLHGPEAVISLPAGFSAESVSLLGQILGSLSGLNAAGGFRNYGSVVFSGGGDGQLVSVMRRAISA